MSNPPAVSHPTLSGSAISLGSPSILGNLNDSFLSLARIYERSNQIILAYFGGSTGLYHGVRNAGSFPFIINVPWLYIRTKETDQPSTFTAATDHQPSGQEIIKPPAKKLPAQPTGPLPTSKQSTWPPLLPSPLPKRLPITLTNSPLPSLLQTTGTTSRDLWLSLERAYAPNTASREYTLKTQLLRITMKGDETPLTYLSRVTEYATALANIGEPMKDKDLVMLTFSSLREEYNETAYQSGNVIPSLVVDYGQRAIVTIRTTGQCLGGLSMVLMLYNW
ncbi:hypothetical protein L1987_11578 [Smallanthus sonchifolius]|uniref:Uncharacterized protein n=1 Tax=Smallanthus sonchifolius TaxID=185202 RepID=A0ACB9JDF5_9ASTR|nr:hypothetical protein L1987_11578 [Smallanthus sonchifolius]